MKYENLMEVILSSRNLQTACSQVISNRGSTGVDGMGVDNLEEYLRANMEKLKQALRSGNYRPHPVLGVDIPKGNGGIRQLGIPTVLDRVVQQAIHQVLSRIWEPTFSNYSYGFRPGKTDWSEGMTL